MDLGLSGKTAVVAGGSRGCGRGISEVLAAEGAAVIFSGRNPDAVAATEAAIRSGGGKAAGVVADMTTRDGALSIVRAARERFDDPDILVVNSPGAVPFLPQDFTNLPSLSNFATRALPRPSATNMFPAASQATSVGRSNRSVGCPEPSPVAGRAGTGTDSALRPSSMATRPCRSNLMTMLVIW